MDVKITPKTLSGVVNAPSSKSYSHRAIIAAALANGVSHISNVTPSNDITATCKAMEALGASITSNGSEYVVEGIFSKVGSKQRAANQEPATLDCGESGSTLRFIIPVAAALGVTSCFIGHGKLPERPVTAYIREFSKKGITFDKDFGLPLNMSGKLSAGEYQIEGDVSSQYITGLLFALPLCEEDSVIKLTSPLQSKPYADMTISTLKQFGIKITESTLDGLPIYLIKGGQKYTSCDTVVEGDYSQAAFFYVANAIGSDITINNLNENSVQGDKAICDIIAQCGEERKPFNVDVGDIPDLVPILTVLGSFMKGKSRIYNAARLKIKESDRLLATANMINTLGGKVVAGDDYLEIEGIDAFEGGVVDSCKDHRLVMSAAIASTYSKNPITITNAQDVGKSYPHFFEDFIKLSGEIEKL